MKKIVVCRNHLYDNKLKKDEIVENEDGIFCKHCLERGIPANIVVYER